MDWLWLFVFVLVAGIVAIGAYCIGYIHGWNDGKYDCEQWLRRDR